MSLALPDRCSPAWLLPWASRGLTGQGKTPSLQVLLERAGAYLADYQRQVPAVVSEEIYDQVARTMRFAPWSGGRTRSDVLVIANDATGWVVFRDVFEVDGKPLRDRDERLEKLLLNPSRGHVRSGAAHRAGKRAVQRQFPWPLVRQDAQQPDGGAAVSDAQNQHRSRFRIDGDARRLTASTPSSSASRSRRRRECSCRRAIGGRRKLLDRARVRPSPAQRAADSDRDVRRADHSTIRMGFAIDPKIGLQVPVGMDEIYQMGAGASIKASKPARPTRSSGSSRWM